MKINVTAEHIRKGKKDDCYFCPIALAIAEKVKTSAEVFTTQVRIYKYEVYDLPKSATTFISRFDKRGGKKTAKPFSFILKGLTAAALFLALFTSSAKADTISYTVVGDGVTASFQLPATTTIAAGNYDPGFGFIITPTNLIINGKKSNDFLAFYTTFGEGGLGAFYDDGTQDDFDLIGSQLFSGPVNNPTFLLGTFQLFNADNFIDPTVTATPTATPEPFLPLLALGLVPLAFKRR